MKNKKFTQAVLLVFVLGVWGTIFYKIYDKLRGDDEEPVPYEALNMGQVSSGKLDTFQLLENYNDPFLNKPVSGSAIGSAHKGSSTANPVVKSIVKTPVTTVAPQIKYLGLIKNKAGKKSVAIVSVNGASSLLQEGESAGNAKLLKLTNDSILVQIDKQKIYVRRN